MPTADILLPRAALAALVRGSVLAAYARWSTPLDRADPVIPRRPPSPRSDVPPLDMTGTVTGRFSSANPNRSNLPRSKPRVAG
jgi:hypothetical protein